MIMMLMVVTIALAIQTRRNIRKKTGLMRTDRKSTNGETERETYDEKEMRRAMLNDDGDGDDGDDDDSNGGLMLVRLVVAMTTMVMVMISMIMMMMVVTITLAIQTRRDIRKARQD